MLGCSISCLETIFVVDQCDVEDGDYMATESFVPVVNRSQKCRAQVSTFGSWGRALSEGKLPWETIRRSDSQL